MSTYEFNLVMNSDVAQGLSKRGEVVVIVKEVNNDSGTEVAWVTFSPFTKNKVTWKSEYGIYASISEIQSGATIEQDSMQRTPATNFQYLFKDNIFQNGHVIESGNGGYYCRNENNQELTFGLTQAAKVGGVDLGLTALNAVRVGNKRDINFKPIEKIKVFTSGKYHNGSVITGVSGDDYTLDLTDKNIQTLRFTGDTVIPG